MQALRAVAHFAKQHGWSFQRSVEEWCRHCLEWCIDCIFKMVTAYCCFWMFTEYFCIWIGSSSCMSTDARAWACTLTGETRRAARRLDGTHTYSGEHTHFITPCKSSCMIMHGHSCARGKYSGHQDRCRYTPIQ